MNIKHSATETAIIEIKICAVNLTCLYLKGTAMVMLTNSVKNDYIFIVFHRRAARHVCQFIISGVLSRGEYYFS